jgi:hypothetical protein
MNFQTVYVGIADNNTILDKKLTEFSEPNSAVVFLSKIDYTDFPADELFNFVKSHIFIPGLEDFKFALEHGKEPKYTILTSLLIRNRYFEAEMDNFSKYIITNSPILSDQILQDIRPASIPGWAKKYDGRFGYVLTTHNEPDDVFYYNYAASINHRHLQKLDARTTNTIVKL